MFGEAVLLKIQKSSVKRANYKFFASYINVNKTKRKEVFNYGKSS